jgi:hypothetical protein
MRRVTILSLVLTSMCCAGTAEASSYCSPTGDFCQAAVKKQGVWRIRMLTFSFRGRIRVCVTSPDSSRSCRRFLLRSEGQALFGFDVRWSRHFPNDGPGRYSVRFSQSGYKLGRDVHFTVGG